MGFGLVTGFIGLFYIQLVTEKKKKKERKKEKKENSVA
jgi:hypothetical protein